MSVEEATRLAELQGRLASIEEDQVNLAAHNRELSKRVAELEGEVTRLRVGAVIQGSESEAWYLALQMLVARLIYRHLPVEIIQRALNDITSDVATDFDRRNVSATLGHLDAVARVLLTDVRLAVRQRCEGRAGVVS